MPTLVTLILGLVLSGPPTEASEWQSTCPPETARGGQLVERYATGQHGGRMVRTVPIVSTSDVVLLADGRTRVDQAICTGIAKRVISLRGTAHQGSTEGWALTFYRVGEHYYAIAVPTTPPVQSTGAGTLEITLRWIPLYILDAEYNVVAAVAM
jgi:hypothetical protein